MRLTTLPPELIAYIATAHCATDTDTRNLYDVYTNCVGGDSSTWVRLRQAHIAKSLAATELRAPRIPLQSEGDLQNTLKRQFGLAVGGRTNAQAQPTPVNLTLNQLTFAMASPNTASRMQRAIAAGVNLVCLVGATVFYVVAAYLMAVAMVVLCLFGPLGLGITSGAMVSASLVRFHREVKYEKARSEAELRGVARARQDLLRNLDFVGECDAMLVAHQTLASLRQAAGVELRQRRKQNLKRDLAGDAGMFAVSLCVYPCLGLYGLPRPATSEAFKGLAVFSCAGAGMATMGAAVGVLVQSAIFATGVDFCTAPHKDKILFPCSVDDKLQTMKTLEDYAYLSYLSRVKSSQTS